MSIIISRVRAWAVVLAILLSSLISMASVPAQAMPSTGIINLSDSCVEWRVYGICWPTDELLIHHFLPVMFVEVVRKAGETILGGGVSGSAANTLAGQTTLTSTQNGMHGFEVHVWDISKLTQLLEMEFGWVLCPLSDAQAESAGRRLISQAESGTIGPTAAGSGGFGFSCGGTSGLNKMIGSYDKMFKLPGTDNVLVYSSEMDEFNWRTGCRDIVKAVKAQALCIDSHAENNMAATLKEFAGRSPCIGAWGNLYPRQYRSTLPEMAAAAKTAYRALDIAYMTTEKSQYYVGVEGKLQPAYPKMGSCFHPGANISQVDQDMAVSQNGNYGFVWWVPVGCCKQIGTTSGGFGFPTGGFGSWSKMAGFKSSFLKDAQTGASAANYAAFFEALQKFEKGAKP